MSRFINPIVLLTRPQNSSEHFLSALAGVAGPFESLIVPAFEYESTQVPCPDFDVGIFTSRAGVMFAPAGAGRIAYCVGDATARAAKQRGYVAISAQGNAADLLSMILAERPSGHMLHVRGESSVGDVRGGLLEAGLNASHVIAYRKAISQMTELRERLKVLNSDLILPLFSGETVSILAHTGVDFSRANVVALSAVIARDAAQLSPLSISTTNRPNHDEMVAAVARLIA